MNQTSLDRAPPNPADYTAAPALGAFAGLLAGENDSFWESLDDALGSLRAAVDADAAEMFVAEPGGGDLLLAACTAEDSDAFNQRTRFCPNEGYPGIVSACNRPLLTRHLPADRRFLRPAVVARGYQTYACVPIPGSATATAGSLHLAWRRVQPDLDATVRLLQAAARLLGMALGADAQKTLAVTAAWLQASRGVSLVESLSHVLELLEQYVGADCGRIVVAQPGGAAPLATSLPAGAGWEPYPGCTPLTCNFVGTGHSILAGTVAAGDPVACKCHPHRREICCLPIVVDGRATGAIQLGYHEPPTQLATRRLPRLLEMAHAVATNIDRVRLASSNITALRTRLSATSSAPSPAGGGAVRLAIRCLGPLSIELDGAPLSRDSFGRTAAIDLLRMLALNAGTPVPRHQLAEWLWPDCDEERAANRLYVAVCALRGALARSGDSGESWIQRGPSTYCLVPAPNVWIDVAAFRGCTDAAWKLLRHGYDVTAIDHLREAIGLYRGDLFADAPYADWCTLDREHLRRTYIDAVEAVGRKIIADKSAASAADLLRDMEPHAANNVPTPLLSALRELSRWGGA